MRARLLALGELGAVRGRREEARRCRRPRRGCARRACPAAPARARSRPRGRALSKCQESAWRGNEQRILRTRFAPISAASPAVGVAGVVVDDSEIVRALRDERVDQRRRACRRCRSRRIMTVAPSGTSASAASGEATNLLIIRAGIMALPVRAVCPQKSLSVHIRNLLKYNRLKMQNSDFQKLA